MQYIQPYIGEIVQALVGLLVMVLLGILAVLRKRVEAWIDAHTSNTQRALLHKMSDEAFALAKARFVDGQGNLKLMDAMDYVRDKLIVHKIPFDDKAIEAAIQKAYYDYQAKTSQTVQHTIDTQNVEKQSFKP